MRYVFNEWVLHFSSYCLFKLHFTVYGTTDGVCARCWFPPVLLAFWSPSQNSQASLRIYESMDDQRRREHRGSRSPHSQTNSLSRASLLTSQTIAVQTNVFNTLNGGVSTIMRRTKDHPVSTFAFITSRCAQDLSLLIKRPPPYRLSCSVSVNLMDGDQ